jgi:hypothetical protein
MVLDVDEVLVNVTPAWVAKAKAHPDLGNLPTLAALPPGGSALASVVFARPVYFLLDWLKIPAHLRGVFDSLYRDDGEFYDDLPPTPFASGVAALLKFPGAVGACHIISHVMGDGDAVNASKMRWLDRHIDSRDGRVSIHLLELGTKKSDVMLRHCKEPDSFADDSMLNVLDVMATKGLNPRQILIPRMGYNAAPREVVLAARVCCVELSYYETVC